MFCSSHTYPPSSTPLIFRFFGRLTVAVCRTSPNLEYQMEAPVASATGESGVSTQRANTEVCDAPSGQGKTMNRELAQMHRSSREKRYGQVARQGHEFTVIRRACALLHQLQHLDRVHRVFSTRHQVDGLVHEAHGILHRQPSLPHVQGKYIRQLAPPRLAVTSRACYP